jgi:hypothetical protein
MDKSYQILTNNYIGVEVPFIKGLNYRLNTGVRIRFTDRAQYRGRDTQEGLAALGDASIDNAVSNNTVIGNNQNIENRVITPSQNVPLLRK